MPCDNCAALTRQVRELREELAEYSQPDAVVDSHRVLKWLRKPASPQTARLAIALARAHGRMVHLMDLADEVGLGNVLNVPNSVRVQVSHLRRCLERHGHLGVVVNHYGEGFHMDKSVSREVLAAGVAG